MPVKVPINLATEPFRRDRPVVAGSVAAAALLVITLLLQTGAILTARGQSAQTRVTLDRLNAQLAKIAGEQTKLDATLRKPENAEVLERSVFLNSLIERKAISWTRIFADLEKVMPRDVRLVSVRLPQVTAQNQVLLDMEVGAESAKPVLELLKRLEASPQFGSPNLVSSAAPSQTDKLWKYRVGVSYAQKL